VAAANAVGLLVNQFQVKQIQMDLRVLQSKVIRRGRVCTTGSLEGYRPKQ
jgi:hypothetical protein